MTAANLRPLSISDSNYKIMAAAQAVVTRSVLMHLRQDVFQVLHDLFLRQERLVFDLKIASQLFELGPTHVQQDLAVVVLVLHPFELDLQVLVTLHFMLQVIDALLQPLGLFRQFFDVQGVSLSLKLELLLSNLQPFLHC